MKQKLLFLLSLTFLQIVSGQCLRTGSFIQSDPQYSISGDANITFTTSGDKSVNFQSNFQTVQGADLRVYLSKTNDIALPGADAIQISGQLENDAGGFGGAGISPITGMMSFNIPSTTELTDFDFIVIQCIAINERWGHVSLGANTGADCATLNITNNILNSVSISPNPSNGNITLKAPVNTDATISVYNVLGKKVYNTSQALNSELNLTQLRTGIYLVKISADNNQVTKRLIIK